MDKLDDVPEWLVKDPVVHLVRVTAVKRRQAANHLEEDSSEAPPVNRPVVRLLAKDLGRQVLGRSAERGRRVSRMLQT